MGLDGHIYKGRMDTRLPGILGKDGECPDTLEFLPGSRLGDKGQLSISWYGHVLDHWALRTFVLLLKPSGCFLSSGEQHLDLGQSPGSGLPCPFSLAFTPPQLSFPTSTSVPCNNTAKP